MEQEQIQQQQIINEIDLQQLNNEENILEINDQILHLGKCKYNYKFSEEIPGLLIIPDFVTKEEEQFLLDNLEKEDWDQILKRRTLQFGTYYNQAKKWIEKKTMEYPPYLEFLYQRLRDNGIMMYDKKDANTLINEYYPGQVLYPHIDVFGEIIIGLNMQAPCLMNFIEVGNEKREIKIQQDRRSLYVMTGDSRYLWKHGILEVNKRRVSLTIRSTKPNPKKFPDLIIKQN